MCVYAAHVSRARAVQYRAREVALIGNNKIL